MSQPTPRLRRVTITMVIMSTLAWSSSSAAQDSIAVGTRNEFEFDLDGALLETAGDLGVVTASATLSGLDVPPLLRARGLLSVTLSATATGGNVSADRGSRIEARGIGVASPTDNTRALTSDLNRGESLTLEVDSTGTGLAMLFGLDLSGARGTFPFAEVTLTGATVNGASVLNTETSLADFGALAFDTPVTSVTVASTGDDGFRIKGVYLSPVPEPASLILLTVAGCCLPGRSLRRR